MKQLLLLTTCLLLIASCKPSTGPDALAIPAVMPQDWSTFTYSYIGANPAVQLTEHVTILDTIASQFYEIRTSDTVGGFSTDTIEFLQVLANGDLKRCGCDGLALPIGSHQPYQQMNTTPVKRNGIVGDGTIMTSASYLAEETIRAAGENFLCTKVNWQDSIYLRFGTHSLDTTFVITDTYWYSAKLGYFVKGQREQSAIGGQPSTVWSRTLLSYKLGK